MQKVTILTKIKFKAILFENIQGFIGIRHYILPYLINNDKILQNKLKIFNSILKDNKLSSNFINNFFTFISDRVLFRIVNEDKNLMDDSQYIPEEGINKFQRLKKRILDYYKSGKYHNDSNISISDLKKYIPNDREFALFLFDFLENKNQILSVFTSYNLEEKNNINKFLSYYEKNEDKEKINQIKNDNVESFYAKMNRKVLINLAFIGNKYSGKSTTVGHLLYSTGNIDQNYFKEISLTAKFSGMISSKFSMLLNTSFEEKIHSTTIHYRIKKFETTKYDFNLIDLPGDFSYSKKLMKGISLADAAVIIVSAKNENLQDSNIKDYLIITYTMGIRQIIIAINKMDQTKKSEYSEAIFLKVKKYMIDLCENIGFSSDNIQFIAYSGYTGQNLVNKYEDEDILKSNKMDWYKGKTLLESLDEIKPPKRCWDKPLKIAIDNVDNTYTKGTVFEGKILSGQLKTNMKICIPIRNIEEIVEKECKSIEIHNHRVNEAIAGDIIGFKLKGISMRPAKCSLAFNEKIMDCMENTYNLRVKILVINKKIKLNNNSDLVLFCYTLNVPIKIEKIEYLVDEANKILEKEPKEIKYGEHAIIIINLDKKYLKYDNSTYCYFEKFNENPFFGSIALFNSEFIAVGKIKDINV